MEKKKYKKETVIENGSGYIAEHSDSFGIDKVLNSFNFDKGDKVVIYRLRNEKVIKREIKYLKDSIKFHKHCIKESRDESFIKMHKYEIDKMIKEIIKLEKELKTL